MGTGKKAGISAPPTGASGLPRLDNFDYESTSTRQTETSQVDTESSRVSNRAVLTVITGGDAGRVVAFGERGSVTVGRTTNCELVISDPGVSRRHAQISRSDSRFVVEDLGSKNGTFVDGERVVERRWFDVGSTIQIGPHVVLRLVSMTRAEEALARQLYDSSMRDALTKVYNRRYLLARLASELSFADRHGSALSFLLFDLDHFKRVNDTWGHVAGDSVLASCAAAVASTLRTEDVLARIGGEEFAAILRGINYEQALQCAERVRRAVEARVITVEGDRIPVTISLGVASADDCMPPRTPEHLFAIADERLYGAKNGGRNCVRGRR